MDLATWLGAQPWVLRVTTRGGARPGTGGIQQQQQQQQQQGEADVEAEAERRAVKRRRRDESAAGDGNENEDESGQWTHRMACFVSPTDEALRLAVDASGGGGESREEEELSVRLSAREGEGRWVVVFLSKETERVRAELDAMAVQRCWASRLRWGAPRRGGAPPPRAKRRVPWVALDFGSAKMRLWMPDASDANVQTMAFLWRAVGSASTSAAPRQVLAASLWTPSSRASRAAVSLLVAHAVLGLSSSSLDDASSTRLVRLIGNVVRPPAPRDVGQAAVP